MKIVITDCDHATIDAEQKAADAAGHELQLTQSATEEEVIANAAGADALVVQYAPITAAVLDALPSVRAVGRYGVGVDTVDVEAATQRGVAVCNVPDYGTEAVSDHAIALALATVRGLRVLDREVRSGAPDLQRATPIQQLSTLRFGVLGFGRIGQATARKAAGLGFDVAVTDIRLETGTSTEEGWPVLALAELLQRSDVLSVHTPLDPSTQHLLNAETLAQLPAGATVVNTARGGVVDTDAIAAALASGHLQGAGLDVFEDEPLPADHPLTRFDRCILTPHAAFYTEQSYTELKRRTVQNVVDVLAGTEPQNILNPEVLQTGRR